MSEADPGFRTLDACEKAREAAGVERYGEYGELERLANELPGATVRLAEVLFTIEGDSTPNDGPPADYAMRRRVAEVLAPAVASELRRQARTLVRELGASSAQSAAALFVTAEQFDGQQADPGRTIRESFGGGA